MSKAFIYAIGQGNTDYTTKQVMKRTMLDASDNFTWLKSGQIVLIKVASNSDGQFPMSTDPLLVQATVELVRERGGTPIVGDMAGVEYVLLTPKGVKRGSTIECFKRNGIYGTDYTCIGFEDKGWEGFHLHYDPKATDWPEGFYVTNVLKMADHVIYLARAAMHSQAGISLGAKSGIGLLRTDSRMFFHRQRGPFDSVVRWNTLGSGLKVRREPGLDFFRMIPQTNLAVKSKLRLVAISATKMLLTLGPNQKAIKIGDSGLIRSYIHVPAMGFMVAADDFSSDAVAYAVMQIEYGKIPRIQQIKQEIMTVLNGRIVAPQDEAVYSNPLIKYPIELGLAQRVTELETDMIPPTYKAKLMDKLEM